MEKENTHSCPTDRLLSVWLVQPAAAPYWHDRIIELSNRSSVDLTVVLERKDMTYYTGFQNHSFNSIPVITLNSIIIKKANKSRDFNTTFESFWSLPIRLTIEIIKKRPDVVLVCNSTQTIFAYLACLITRTRIILMVEDTPHSMRKVGYARRKLKGFAYCLAHSWTAYSKDSMNFLDSLFCKKRTFYVPWSIAPAQRCPIRQAIPRPVKVIFVGQLIKRKGVDLLLQAWSAMPPSARIKAELIIVGDGPLRETLLMQKNTQGLSEVSFVGKLDYNSVQKHLSECDLFVFPTLEDLYGIALLEAVASGCAIITTPFAGGSELVTEQNGWITDPRELDAFSKLIATAISNPSLLSEMGTKSISIADNYMVNTAIDKLLDAIISTKLLQNE